MAESTARSKLLGCVIAGLAPVVVMGIAATVLVVNNRPPKIAIPTHSVPKDNAWTEFLRAGTMVVQVGNMGPYNDLRPQNEWTIPELEKLVRDNRAPLAVFESALKKPCVAPPVRSIRAMRQQMNLMPHFRFITYVRLGEGYYYERLDEPGKAADARLDCIEMGAKMQRRAWLIPNLVGAQIQRMGAKGIDALLPRLSAQELDRAAKRVQRIRALRVPFGEMVLEDGRVDAAMLSDAVRQPEYARQSLNPVRWVTDKSVRMEGDGSEGLWGHAKYAFQNKGGLIRQEEAFCREFAARTRQPYTGKPLVAKPANPALSRYQQTLMAAWKIYGRNEAELNLLQTEIALRRYMAANGSYPKRLGGLVPVYLNDVPVDPFGQGRPLVYRVIEAGKGFMLYSLGSNMKDDGGLPATEKLFCDVTDQVLGKEN